MSSNNQKHDSIPSDGIKGLRENAGADALSGFLVFLLALPLSLGIARASDFPPIMGLITAMIGGLLISLFSGSRLTIKGPAAGLIVIVAGAVAEFGQGNTTLGWQLTLGAIAAAGVLQILFGFLRLGTLVDFFPLSAVHGMLAAIGIIIVSKQLHILLGVSPVDHAGKPLVEPFALMGALPDTLRHIHRSAAIIGLVSLAIVLGWPLIRQPLLRKIPGPLVVLAVAIPLAMWMPPGAGQLVHFDHNLADTLQVNIRFDGLQTPWIFIKYVIMFALVGSLESLLTVKATDMLDPWQRKSNANRDLAAVGAGNILASVFGGLPMISEVARSSANVNNGGRTRFANYFHGVFLLIFLLLDLQFNDLIPTPALAAMLIGVGIKLASPREFGAVARIGLEQLIIFCTTIAVTLATDLLLGIAAGVVVKLILSLVFGAPLKALFRAPVKIHGHHIAVGGAAVFSNWLGIRKALSRFPENSHVSLDLQHCNVVDHTVIENLHHLQQDFAQAGGNLHIEGMDEFRPVSRSHHEHAARARSRQQRTNLKTIRELWNNETSAED